MWNRREFLSTAAACVGSSTLWTWDSIAAATPAQSGCKYATQTGVLEQRAGCDLFAQVACAAELGFGCFSDPAGLRRPTTVTAELAAVVRAHGLTFGPVRAAAWYGGRPQRATWERRVEADLQTAAELGATAVQIELGVSTWQMLLSDADRQVITAAVERTQSRARACGVTVLWELWSDASVTATDYRTALERLVTSAASDARGLLEQGLPETRIVLDFGRLSHLGLDPVDVWREFASVTDLITGCPLARGIASRGGDRSSTRQESFSAGRRPQSERVTRGWWDALDQSDYRGVVLVDRLD